MIAIGELQNWKDLQQQCGNPELTVCSDEAAYLQLLDAKCRATARSCPDGSTRRHACRSHGLGFRRRLSSGLAPYLPRSSASKMGGLAVSEDRRNDPPLPGVDYQLNDGEFVISGHKTWVTAVNSVEHLVIKAV